MTSPREPTRSPWFWWSTAAVAAAVLVWVGGVLLHLLGWLGPVVGVMGVVTSAVAWLHERGRALRAALVGTGLACAVATGLYALVLSGTVGWPPAGW